LRIVPVVHSGRLMGLLGAVALGTVFLVCVLTLPWTMGRDANGARRYEAADLSQILLPPSWAAHAPDEKTRRDEAAVTGHATRFFFGSDRLGRDLFARCLAGGGISLGIGLGAAMLAVLIGTVWGTVAGYFGGRTDAVLMRIVDIIYGLPTILLVVLLAVASDGLIDRSGRDLAPGVRGMIGLGTLLLAISGVSWLTMARVIRGQVLSLRQQPFMEACRATGVPLHRQFLFHLLPNLSGPIIVYATLTVPAAILAESFLSFLGIGVREPLPSWGNLAAAGLSELNTVRVRWWLLFWPCLFIGITLLALNFVGESLRQVIDPRRRVA